MEGNISKSYTEELLETNRLDSELEDNKTISNTEIFKTCLNLGVISFGGPIAHIGIFNKILINEKKYIKEDEFTQLFSICNVVPGPTSSQLLTAIATIKTNSLLGGIISFFCFNMPALFIMITAAFISKAYQTEASEKGDWFYVDSIRIGISQGAVAIVLQAALTLSTKIKESNFQLALLFISTISYLVYNNYITMIVIMTVCGILSLYNKEDKYLLRESNISFLSDNIPFLGFPALITFIVVYLLIYFSLIVSGGNMYLYLMESFYRIGSLIIGGGHVVIPMIISEYSSKSLVSDNEVLNAFSIVSLLPGPMFNIAGYIGTLINGVIAGFISALSLFLPGMLLLFSALGFMSYIYKNHNLQYFLRGVSTAGIGFIFTAAFILLNECCFKNNHYNGIIGILNVLLAFYLIESHKLSVPLVMAISAVYSLIFSLILYR